MLEGEGRADTQTAEGQESETKTTGSQDLEGIIRNRDEILGEKKQAVAELKALKAKLKELEPLADEARKRKEAEESELEKATRKVEEATAKAERLELELAKRDRWRAISDLADGKIESAFLEKADDGEADPADVVETAKGLQEKFLERLGREGAEIPGTATGTAARTNMSEKQKIIDRYNELGKKRGDHLALQERIRLKAAHPFLRELSS